MGTSNKYKYFIFQQILNNFFNKLKSSSQVYEAAAELTSRQVRHGAQCHLQRIVLWDKTYWIKASVHDCAYVLWRVQSLAKQCEHGHIGNRRNYN